VILENDPDVLDRRDDLDVVWDKEMVAVPFDVVWDTELVETVLLDDRLEVFVEVLVVFLPGRLVEMLLAEALEVVTCTLVVLFLEVVAVLLGKLLELLRLKEAVVVML